MQYLLLVYTDAELLDKLPEEEFNTRMRDCPKYGSIEVRPVGDIAAMRARGRQTP